MSSNRLKSSFLKTLGVPYKVLKRNAAKKSAWRTIGKEAKYYRSKWEANYARFLDFLKKQNAIQDWKHEPQTFWFENIKRGVRSYLPDFQVIRNDGSHYWVEVKGYMDQKSRTKIKRFQKYYPDETLVVIDSKWFLRNNKKMKIACKGWE